MDETTKPTRPTAVLAMDCCSCRASFRQRVKGGGSWRQRAAQDPAGKAEVRAYMCPTCAARFTTEEAIEAFLDASLDEQLEALAACPAQAIG
jgi:hypothetical protein